LGNAAAVRYFLLCQLLALENITLRMMMGGAFSTHGGVINTEFWLSSGF
jgi:hypothetical protein